MPCHVARYRDRNEGTTGWLLFHDQYYDIGATDLDTQSFLDQHRSTVLEMTKDLSRLKDRILQKKSVEILSPVTDPCRIMCLGSNYPQSRIETGMNPGEKSFNTIFHKSDASLCKPDSNIVRPSHIQLLDYEVELGIIIGKEIRESTNITRENLHQYVAGIVMAHDVTARDVQIPQVQFFKGKSYRTFCPTGPFLCLLDKGEMHYLDEMKLELKVDGEKRQEDISGNMIYKVHETLSELSTISNLSPGDMLLTGSPGGCALTVPPAPLVKLLGLLPDKIKWEKFVSAQAKNPRYLQPGNLLELRISSMDGKVNLGTQRNLVVEEGAT